MYVQNGKLPLREPTKRPALWSKLGNRLSALLRELLPPLKIAFALMLVALLILLAGCATTSTPPDILPKNPEPPPSRLSESPPNYLSSALENISAWRKTLNGLTSRHAH
jgi:hypothetical protein